MRLLSLPLPTVLSGLVAVLVGYASSAAIIWQAALAAGATPTEIAGWMTALGIAMGISTLTLTLWYRAPVLTAWSTPGAALLVTGLQGLSLPDAVGIFIVANALIVLCGVTGLFARLMRIIPHSLAAAMLAGILLRFGLQAFGTLNGEFVMCGGMLLAWLLFKVFAPRYAVIAAMVMGITVALIQGKVAMSGIHFAPVWPTFVPPPLFIRSKPERRGTALPGNDGIAKRPRRRHNEGVWLSASCLSVNDFYRIAGAAAFAIWRLFYLHCRHYSRHLSKPGRAPRSNASLVSGRRRRRFLFTCRVVWRFDNRADGRPAG